jgi:tetratricopeptide repeat protein
VLVGPAQDPETGVHVARVDESGRRIDDDAREAGDRGNLALATGNLGDLAMRRREHARAITFSKEALTLFRELGRDDLISWTLYNLAFSLFRTEQWEQAVSAARERESRG